MSLFLTPRTNHLPHFPSPFILKGVLSLVVVQISHFLHNALISVCKISACSGAPRDNKNQKNKKTCLKIKTNELNVAHPSFMSSNWRVRVRYSFFVGSRLVWSCAFYIWRSLSSALFSLFGFWFACVSPFVPVHGALCIFISVTFFFLGLLHLLPF